MPNKTELQEIIQRINFIRKNKATICNAYFSATYLLELLVRDEVEAISSEEFVFIIVDEECLRRLYFYAQDEQALQMAKKRLNISDKPLVVDVVGKGNGIEETTSLLTRNGFEKYSVFIRMSGVFSDIHCKGDYSCVEFAVETDVDAIREMLVAEFDPLFAHIPTREEILSAVTKEEITVVRKQGRIVGMAFFENVAAKSVCLRYFLVNVDCRRQGLGELLFANTVSKLPTGFFVYLWVGIYNSAVGLYEKMGFRKDGLKDNILIFRG